MIDEERVKLMTKLAVFEQHENKSVLGVTAYLKKDYIALRVIYTLLATTVAFFLACIVVVAARYNVLLGSISNMNVFKTAYILIGSWIGFELFFVVVAYVFYSIRYKRCKAKATDYIENLNILDQLYASEEE